MEKLKALVLTKKTKLPVAIQRSIEAVGCTPFVSEAKTNGDLQRLIEADKYNFILIDGEYELSDPEHWVYLNKLTPTHLKIHLLETPAKELPRSLTLLKYCDALKGRGTLVGIFIDKPSQHVVHELGRLGASFVWKSLNRVSEAQSSVYEVIHGTKAVAKGLKALGSALLEKLQK